jgi:hypothetical protein
VLFVMSHVDSVARDPSSPSPRIEVQSDLAMRRIGSLVSRLVTTQCTPAITHGAAGFSTGAAPAQRRSGRLRAVLGGIGLGLTGSWLMQNNPMADDVQLAWLIPLRLARDVYAAAAIVAGKCCT